MDLANIPFFDNHTHVLDYNATNIDPDACIGLFLHGLREHIDKTKPFPCMIEASPVLKQHIRSLGSVRSLVHHMSKYFRCKPELEDVFAHRAKAAANGIDSYAQDLYKDANIGWCMLDSELPLGDSAARFPCEVLRLFQMDAPFDKALAQCESYAQFLASFLGVVGNAVKEGYAGIKCHVGERFTLAVRKVGREEAEKVFAVAKSGDKAGIETVYFAALAEMFLLAEKLDVSVHIHTGSSGDPADGDFAKLDPLLMAPFLYGFLKTKIVFLHGSYPNTKNAALMAHAFPNVYVDYSWTLPWTVCGFDATLKDAIELAPHSKIMLGTGQHGVPEIAWLAAKIARSCLSAVLENIVKMDIMSEAQARDTAEMLLCKNAQALYKLADKKVALGSSPKRKSGQKKPTEDS
ncbi:hypothetical protein FACS1894204_10030 [Synergistales bacterium]|nr:hypothetical protein FACS1894204_10030 [Synergistales bacterium]